MATHYNSSSRGPVEIGTMRYEHALNARDKLVREGAHKHRGDELDALNKHIAGIEATFEESPK